MGLFHSKNAKLVPSREQIAQRLKEYGESRGVHYLCPMCRHNRWDVAGVVTHRLEGEGSKKVTTTSVFAPMALLVCGQCTYSAQFSLVALGFFNSS